MSVIGLSVVLLTLGVLTLERRLFWHPAMGAAATCESSGTQTESLCRYPAAGISATYISFGISTDNYLVICVNLGPLYNNLFWHSTNCITMNKVSNVSRRSSRNLPRLNYVNMSVREDSNDMLNN